jgi:hypothetical protein
MLGGGYYRGATVLITGFPARPRAIFVRRAFAEAGFVCAASARCSSVVTRAMVRDAGGRPA